MVVLVTTSLKPGVRGELTRWMIEPKAGVFVGNLPARVRDLLWEKLEQKAGSASGLMIFTTRTEQGFSIRSFGDPIRYPIDFDGLTLIAKHPKS
ncbi:MAG: type I-E CRISPR-associated endoribonuclease Cas2e [Fimbriimonas sp.]